jgi:hypothetical protein
MQPGRALFHAADRLADAGVVTIAQGGGDRSGRVAETAAAKVSGYRPGRVVAAPPGDPIGRGNVEVRCHRSDDRLHRRPRAELPQLGHVEVLRFLAEQTTHTVDKG